MKNSALTFGTIFFIVVLTAVIIYCDIYYFIYLIPAYTTPIISMLLGTSLGCCPLVLIPLLNQCLHKGADSTAIIIFIILSFLIGISINAASVWFENNYQKNYLELQYQKKERQLLEELLGRFQNQSIQLHHKMTQENIEHELNQTQKLFNLAGQVDQKILEVVSMIRQLNKREKRIIQTIVPESLYYRWLLWLLLSGVINLYPAISMIVLISQYHSKSTQAKIQPNKETKKAALQSQINIVEQAVNKRILFEEKASKVKPPNNPNQKSNSTRQSMSLEDHIAKLKQDLTDGRYSGPPSIRAIMRKHKIGYKKCKKMLALIPPKLLK